MAVAALVATSACAKEQPDPFKLLTVEDVAAMVGKPGVAILDANPPDVFAKNHVPGAVLVEKPLAARLPQDKTAKLVFYCKNPK